MKIAIVLIALCAALYVLVLLTPNRPASPPSSGEGFAPPSWANVLADLPFGPGLDLKTDKIVLAPNVARQFEIPGSKTQVRSGKFALSSGKLVKITYSCPNPSRKSCIQTQCLVAADMAPPSGCDMSNRKKTDEARIAVLDIGGSITLVATGSPATVSVN